LADLAQSIAERKKKVHALLRFIVAFREAGENGFGAVSSIVSKGMLLFKRQINYRMELSCLKLNFTGGKKKRILRIVYP